MSTLKIEERITVTAPPPRVWKFLLDPARVAACLPGAKLDGTEGEHTFLGTMKVKVGPVLMEFKGKATMSEIVEAERRVTLTGTGNDKSGGGSAKMEMKSRIVEKEGGSEIVVIADVDLAGKLVRFGRGMMEGISKQMFKQFSERVQAALAAEEDEEEDEGDASEEAAPAAEAKPEEAKVEEAKPEEAKSDEAKPEEAKPEEAKSDEAEAKKDKKEESEPAKVEESPKAPESEAGAEAAKGGEESEPKAAEGAPEAETKAPRDDEGEQSAEAEGAKASEAKADTAEPAEAAAKPAAKVAKKKAKKKAAPIVKREDEEALDAGSLVWAAIWEWIKNLFRRIFGGGNKG